MDYIYGSIEVPAGIEMEIRDSYVFMVALSLRYRCSFTFDVSGAGTSFRYYEYPFKIATDNQDPNYWFDGWSRV